MPRRSAPILAACALAALLPAPAAAQSPPAPEPPEASLSTTLSRSAFLPGERMVVRGRLTPYVAGQTVTVRFDRGSRRLRAVKVAVREGGAFTASYTPRRSGPVSVRASHRRTPELGTAVARRRAARVLTPSASAGARGPVVRMLQARLAARGYVVGRRGLYDARTARAVLAFRKVTGMRRTNVASSDVFARLVRGGGRFRVRYPGHGRHIEADISRQVVALIDGGKVRRIYPTSSGAPATPTIRGTFRVYRKDPGTNSLGMVHSAYFQGGYAIHGYKSVPVYNASHGCLRVPVPDALTIFNWLRMGDRVDVYR